jgi:RNA polymerase sigma-70 factor (ECF subfamily)
MASPAGYVYRTALNLTRSRLRRLAVRARHASAATPSLDQSESVLTGQRVRDALASLPPTQREVVVLVGWLGYRSEELADILGIDAASVRGRLHRGRASLERMLGGSDE